MRTWKAAVTIGAIVAGSILWITLSHLSGSHVGFVESAEDRSVFFRLKASYLHGEEKVDFDIVAGCKVRITNYRDSESSFDAYRDPLFFVKATKDGGAALQIVPSACSGETVESGRVPKDFLPGAIWYDDRRDLTLGVAYVTEEAFEDPKAKLRFLGATITRATRAEWEAFQPINAQNLIDQQRYIHGNPKQPTVDELHANLWNKTKLVEWHPHFSCHGMQRFRFTDSRIKRLIGSFWPSTRPQYWIPADEQQEVLKRELLAPGKVKGVMVDGVPLAYYLYDYNQAGFPTRARNGRIRPGSPWGNPLPTTILPVRADLGVPWISPGIATAPEIHFDVELSSSPIAGDFYCYSDLRGDEDHVPGYFKRRFTTRVDGLPVLANDGGASAWPQGPQPFYERDEYFYRPFELDLN
jgi:hypothetical protein